MAENTVKVRIKHAVKTTAEWEKSNPILLLGEVGYDSTLKRTKTGDGVHTWNQLPYDDELLQNRVAELEKTEIGGRNLATNTNKGTVGWHWSMQVGNVTSSEIVENEIRTCKLTRDTTAQSGWSVIFYTQISRNKWEPNTVYTVSLDVKASVSTNFILSFKKSNGEYNLIKEDKMANVPKANTWTKLIWVVTSVDTLPSATGQYVYLTNMNSEAGVWYQFKNLKIEKGNKATDWTPAPEDLVSDWNESDISSYSYIKNKPTLGTMAAESKEDYSKTGHTHNYLPLSGGTLSGNLSFSAVTNTTYPAKSNKITWSGSTDGAEIYYQVDASDTGRLVFNLTDDSNTRICFALNGTVKSYIDANGNFSANASTSSNIYSTTTNPSSGTTYYIPFHSGASTYNKSLLNNDGLRYWTKEGTTNDVGVGELGLGNSISSGTAGNKRGMIYMYGTSSGYTEISCGNNTTSNISITLPSSGGTLARTVDNVASANKWYTARTITLTGAVTGSISIDGSADVTLNTTTNHNHDNRYVYDKASASGTFNTVATWRNAMGMVNISDPTSGTASYVNPNGQRGWHHFINMSYQTESTNMWQTQIANAAGTTDLWVRSRSGGAISDSTAWTAPWTRILTGSNWGNVITCGTLGAIPLSGSTSITGVLRSNSEIQTTSQNAFRMVSGNYGVFLRNDGNNTYFLVTNSGDQYGIWNNLRPFYFNNSTGQCTINGNASSASSLSYFQNTSSTNMGQDTCNSNAIGYISDYSGTAITTNVKDGALYRQAYNTSWVHEIYGDYRTGSIAVRGKNSGTWQSWKRVLDSSNYTSYALPLSGGTLTGALNIGSSLKLWSDGEGGNIRLFAPNSTTNCFEFDVYNGSLRLYYSTNGGSSLSKSWSFGTDGVLTATTFKGSLDGNATTATTASGANVLNQNTRMDYGWNGVNYFNISGTAGNAAKVNNTPTSAWWHIMRFNHANGNGYYTDLAVPFNDTSLYYKRICGGSVQNDGWIKVLDSNNYTSYCATSGHTHGLLHSNFTVVLENTTTDSGWSMINSTYNGFLLKSIRTQGNAPSWIYGNYSAGIAFGGSDTKGVISVCYSTPSVKFAGGNGAKPVWYFNLSGTNATSYNLDNYPTKTGSGASGTWGINVTGSSASCTGNSATATKATQDGSGNIITNTYLNKTGDVCYTAITGGGSEQNVAGYRLIATATIGAWTNRRAVFAVSGRHGGNGIFMIAYGCNSGTVSTSNTYCQINYFGNTSCGSIVNSNTLQCYISSDGATLYFFYYFSDYDSTRFTCLDRWNNGFLPNSNGTWMTSISTSTYGTLIASTRINVATSCEGNANTSTTSTYSYYPKLVASNEIRFDINTKPSSVMDLWFGYMWSDGSKDAKISGYRFADGNSNLTKVYASQFIGSLDGNATSATTASKLGSSDVGTSTNPIYLSTGTATACSGRTVPGIKSASSATTLGWGTNNNYVADISMLAYWNGAYSGTSSNLAYCNKGAFGSIVTKSADDYSLSGHTHNYAGSSSAGGSATSAVKLDGFSIRQGSITWGTLAGSSYKYISRLDTNNGGSIAFADKDGQTSFQIDGYFYQNEGNYMCLDTNNYTGYALPLTGGTMTGQIQKAGSSSTWIKGRSYAMLRMSVINGYSPFASIKTTNGSWEIGSYDQTDYIDDLVFNYCTDTNFNANTNTLPNQIKFLENGHIKASLDGNSSTATKLATSRNIFGKSFDGSSDISGKATVYGTYTNTASARFNTSAAIEIRECDQVSNTHTDEGYAPRIGFHWGNVIAGSLVMNNAGKFVFRMQDGTSVAPIIGKLDWSYVINKTNATTTASGLMSSSDKILINMLYSSSCTKKGRSTILGTGNTEGDDYGTGDENFIGAGYGNALNNSTQSAILCGQNNTITPSNSSSTWYSCSSILNGYSNYVYGDNSLVGGVYNISRGNQVVFGHLSKSNSAGSISGTSGNAFIIGNGSSTTSRNNAFRISYGGTIYATNSTVATGADYAEYFEWADGNPNDEDRVGLFVTFDEENPNQIRIANKNEYILGIVSGNPNTIGNGDEDWCGKYVKDSFDRYIEEEYEYEEVHRDSNGNEIIKKKIGTRFKQNPNYDPSIEYIQREDRPEWSAIGMVGVLSVYDDGTCNVNGYCKCGNNGIATKSDTYEFGTYRVIERIEDNIIKIIVK